MKNLMALFFFLMMVLYGCKSETPTDIPDGDNDLPADSIFIGGSFTITGNSSIKNLAFWDGENWNALGLGVSGSNVNIESLCYYNGELYVGGFIDSAGGIPVQNIARWDGNNWSSVGNGINGRVTSLMVFEGELYVGGWFSNAGGIQTDNIAKWNGTTWSNVGEGLSDEVYALATFNNELYVGGWFTKNTLGNFSANKIARWNGNNWDSVSTGISLDISGGGWVHNITTFNNELYASGNFNKCDSISVVNIAKWNTSAWQLIQNSTLSNRTYSSFKFKNEIHFAGESDSNSQNDLPYYAVWDGTNWKYNLFSFDGSPYALCSSDNYLYVGGNFKLVNGKTVNGIFKWDGSNLYSLNSGIVGYVSSILVK